MTDVSPLWMPNAPRLKDALQERKDRRGQSRREESTDHEEYPGSQDAENGPASGTKTRSTDTRDERPQGGKGRTGRILDIEV